MNNRTPALRLVLATSLIVSSLTVSSAYAATWNGEPGPQGAAQDNSAPIADPPAQVTTDTRTVVVTNTLATIRSVETPARQYGPKPSFDSLDTNHDGVITESEAAAHPPLANDYLHVALKGSRGVTRAEYDRW